MKIEETFRNLKSLLNFHKLMNKHRALMQKIIALVLIAYAIIQVVSGPCDLVFSKKEVDRTSDSPALLSS